MLNRGSKGYPRTLKILRGDSGTCAKQNEAPGRILNTSNSVVTFDSRKHNKAPVGYRLEQHIIVNRYTCKGAQWFF